MFHNNRFHKKILTTLFTYAIRFGSHDLTRDHMMLTPQIIQISDYRTQLYDYLKNRMMAIAPNLTIMVGELVGARLIAHAGQLNIIVPVY